MLKGEWHVSRRHKRQVKEMVFEPECQLIPDIKLVRHQSIEYTEDLRCRSYPVEGWLLTFGDVHHFFKEENSDALQNLLQDVLGTITKALQNAIG